MRNMKKNIKPLNPFLITGYLNPDYFCNREKETNSMINALQNDRNLTLIAPRRMGKTGLIKNVFYHLEQTNPEIAFFYMDIFFTRNLGEFVQLFASTVLEKSIFTPQKTIKRVTNFITGLRPTLTVDEFTGMPKITVNVVPSQEENSLKEVFSYLQQSGKRCLVAIDEFQQVVAYPEKGVEALLRSYIKFLPSVHFIFSGSKQHVMQEMFFSAKRPFYQSTQIVSIDSIPKEDYYRFAAAFFEPKRTISQEIFSSMYDEFDGHTWYIQSILNRLYGSKEQKIDIKSVRSVIIDIVSESTYTFEKLLSAYTPSAVNLLKAIAKERCVKEVNSGSFITRYGLKAASSVNTALKKLIDNELIYKTSSGYIVYDRFMAIWLR